MPQKVTETNEELLAKYKDIELTCKDCGKPFVFTKGEQLYYDQRGMPHAKRCQPCRLLRRTSITRNSVVVQDTRPEK